MTEAKGQIYMQCENHVCVYWTLEKCCTLDEVELDVQGRCQTCIYLDIDEAVLQKERQKILKRYEETYTNWEKNRQA